jgi:predicted transcriptional regulator
MATVKVTFTLDAETVARLRTTAARLRQPQSQVVREAIAEYGTRACRLREAERAGLLRAFDRLVGAIPVRPAAAVDAELKALGDSRRRGGRARRRR